ncbi:MAG TPA: response regulator [Chloroflexia bacterium]|nr:response regulator [Chloroflexia bacterium]
MKSVLVVDDEVVLVEILMAVLEDAGYHVRGAANGREGLAALAEEPADLVLCDVMMPVLDGREVCRAMTADPQLRGIPLVMMSAAPQAMAVTECRYAALVAKPFDLDVLIDVVDRLIGA